MRLDDLENTSMKLFDVKSQLRDYIFSRSAEAYAEGKHEKDKIDSFKELEKHNTRMRTSFLQGMGDLPPSDTSLNARRTGSVRCNGFVIENIIFDARKDTPVTGNLYLPDGITEPTGAVLHVLGHSLDGKFREGYQRVCQYLAQAGLIAFAFDPIGQGERLSYYDRETGQVTIPPGTPDHEHGGAQTWPLGQWETRYFLHDVKRAVDYMCSRSEIDPDRIGITGVSGGGMQTLLAMLCEPRIAAAAPACYTTSREAKMYSGQPQDAEQIWPGMTDIGFEHEDFLLAFAPKPLLVLTATGDFFPIEGAHKTVSRARKYWEWFEKGDNLQVYEEDCVHSYSILMAKAATVFFAKHLLNKEVSSKDLQFNLLESKQLQCTISGQVKGDYSEARSVYEENCDHLTELERRRALLSKEKRRKLAKEWLHKVVFSSRRLDDERLNARYPVEAQSVDGERIHAQSVLWKSQEGLFNHGVVFRDSSCKGTSKVPVTLAIWEGGTTQLQSHLNWIREVCLSGRMVLVLDVTGVGPLSPHMPPRTSMRQTQKFGVTHKLNMDLFWLNDSLGAIRVWDVMRALDMAESLRDAQADDVQIYAQGRYSIYAQLAAMLDQRLKHLQVEQGFGPVADWVRSKAYEPDDTTPLVIPGMLQYLDIE